MSFWFLPCSWQCLCDSPPLPHSTRGSSSRSPDCWLEAFSSSGLGSWFNWSFIWDTCLPTVTDGWSHPDLPCPGSIGKWTVCILWRTERFAFGKIWRSPSLDFWSAAPICFRNCIFKLQKEYCAQVDDATERLQGKRKMGNMCGSSLSGRGDLPAPAPTSPGWAALETHFFLFLFFFCLINILN